MQFAAEIKHFCNKRYKTTVATHNIKSRYFVMNVTKRVGRPKIFDEDLALRSAVDVFWTKGYDGTSIKDLTKAMGINSPSLTPRMAIKRLSLLRR